MTDASHPDTSYLVRFAEPADLPALPTIEKIAATRFIPYLSQLDIPLELLEGLTPLRFLRQAQEEKRLWVAIADHEPVGFIVAKFLEESCFIVELDVLPDYGRRGIGAALISACCAQARSRQKPWVTLTTFRYVPWNIPFYQRQGFEIWSKDRWPLEISAIVQHEDRYGFAMQHRVVMGKPTTTVSLSDAWS